MLDISKTAAFEEKQETDLKTIYMFETDLINVISSDHLLATENGWRKSRCTKEQSIDFLLQKSFGLH